jgi:hypothetical protein
MKDLGLITAADFGRVKIMAFFVLRVFPILYWGISKVGGLDLSRRGLDRDLDLDAKKVSVSTVEKISTVSKS